MMLPFLRLTSFYWLKKNNNYYCFYVMPFIENLKKVGS